MNTPHDDLRSWPLDKIAWQEVAPDGTKYALLQGQRNVAGESFVYAFFIPAGFWDPPHSHTADARIVVHSGALFLAFGDGLNQSAAVRYPAGSELLVPAGAAHFDGSSEDTLIVGAAVGPWGTTYLDPGHRPSAGTIPPSRDTEETTP